MKMTVAWFAGGAGACALLLGVGMFVGTIGETAAYGDDVLRTLEYQRDHKAAEYDATAIERGDTYPPADPRFREIMLRMAQRSDHPDLAEIRAALSYEPGEVTEYTQPEPWEDPDPLVAALARSALAGLIGNDYWIGTLQDWIAWMEATQWWSPADINRMVKAWFAEEAVAYATATAMALDP